MATPLGTAGVAADQIVVHSNGKRSLVTSVPSQFRLGRRATFAYVSRPGPYCRRSGNYVIADPSSLGNSMIANS